MSLKQTIKNNALDEMEQEAINLLVAVRNTRASINPKNQQIEEVLLSARKIYELRSLIKK